MRGRAPFYAVWPFAPGLLLTTLALLIALGSYAVAPDWMSMYYAEGMALSEPGLVYVALVLYYVPYALGFSLGLELRRRSRLLLAAAIAVTVVGQALLMVGVWDRYVLVGTATEWRAGSGTPLPEHAEIRIVSVAGGLAMLAAAIVLLRGYAPRRRAWRRGAWGVPHYLNEGEEAIMQALASRLFPDDPAARDLSGEMSRYIGSMVFPNRAGLRLAIFALGWMPLYVMLSPRRFTRMAPSDQDAYLRALEHHPRDVLRTVFIMLKTILSLLHYDRPEVKARIGADYHCKQERRGPAFPDTPVAAATAPSGGSR